MKRWNDPFTPTPEGFRLRMEQTLSGLEEKKMNRNKLTVSMAVVLAVLLISATALAAAAYFGGTVDWNGNFTPYTEEEYLELHPDVTPSAEQPDMRSMWDEILQQVPAGEYWEFRTEEEGRGRFDCDDLEFDSAQRMDAVLAGAGLPVPALGNEFTLSRGYVYYDSDPYLEEPYAEEKYDSGTLYKYRLSEEALTGGVGFYIELMLGEEKVTLTAYSHSTNEDYNDYAFTVGADEKTFVLDVPGYDAVCAEHTDELGFHRTVSLLKFENDRRLRIDIFASTESVSAEVMASLF